MFFADNKEDDKRKKGTRETSSDSVLHIDLWQHVSCGFLNSILHLCKHGDSENESNELCEKKMSNHPENL